MNVQKSKLKAITSLLLLLGGAVLFTSTLPEQVTIQSFESKTTQGHEVFNEISYVTEKHTDIWKMKQSHDGLNAPINMWDEIQIRVDKSKKPYHVSYHQLRQGAEIEFKAACFTCHSNGPRVIRPDYNSKKVTLSGKEKMKIFLMNLKIKSYGRVKIKDENYKLAGDYRKIPLKYFGKKDTEKLNVKTCNYCHNSSNSFFSRGELERQHMGTISHLTTYHQMPPWPLKLSAAEKIQLKAFIKGF